MMPSSTPKAALRKPVDADPITRLLDQNANMDAIDLNMSARICTSSTRPGAPFVGQLIFETNTNLLRMWDGTKWAILEDALQAGWITLESGSKSTVSTATFDVTQGGKFAAADFDMLRMHLRGNVQTASTQLGIRLNGDTGANYDYGRVSFRADTGVNTEGIFLAAQSRWAIQQWGTPGANNWKFTVFEASGQDRSLVSEGFYRGGAVEWYLGSGRWNSTAAVSSIIVLPLANTMSYDYVLEGHLT